MLPDIRQLQDRYAPRVARFDEEAQIGLLLAAVGSLKFGFGAHFGQLQAGFCWILFSSYYFHQTQSIHGRKMDYPSSR